MAEPIKVVVKINLVVAWVILMILYVAGRGVVQMEDKEEKRSVIIYTVAVVTIGVIIVGWFHLVKR